VPVTPVAWTDVLQIVKTVVAAVAAWVIAHQVFALPQPFLAPWAALLVVHATVYRTFWRGATQVATTVVTTALIVLTTGSSDQDHVLLARLFDTAIGVVVGVVVNAMVWPPLRGLTAARPSRACPAVSGGCCTISAGLRDGSADGHVEDWVRRTEDLDVEVDEAWARSGRPARAGG
jgi:hypothetical protein